ncbi:MAG TPA: hypothetical protein PLF72_13400 [Anaerolineaceae bacterium]|nr:hypothetical protein [Anaerolineaceae bacterium]HQO98735.1 hypothetical protein [Anaerolineaceae bacterium]
MAEIIPSIANNMEKSQAYKEQLSRYKNAVRHGFYFEGIFILYAMLEDRLSAFLYYAGVINNNRDKLTTNMMVKPQLDKILGYQDKKNRDTKNISTKIKLMQCIIDWSRLYEPEDPFTENYANILYKQIVRTAGLDRIQQTLSNIQGWCKARNELVHALLTKNPANLHETLVRLSDNGYTEYRNLNNFIKSFKTRNTIRTQFNIQD